MCPVRSADEVNQEVVEPSQAPSGFEEFAATARVYLDEKLESTAWSRYDLVGGSQQLETTFEFGGLDASDSALWIVILGGTVTAIPSRDRPPYCST